VSDDEWDFDPAAAFSPQASEGDDESEGDPATAFSPPPDLIPGPFTPAHFRHITDAELEPSESD